jgi:Mn2+/Fe2+ NRAMP family transporter
MLSYLFIFLFIIPIPLAALYIVIDTAVNNSPYLGEPVYQRLLHIFGIAIGVVIGVVIVSAILLNNNKIKINVNALGKLISIALAFALYLALFAYIKYVYLPKFAPYTDTGGNHDKTYTNDIECDYDNLNRLIHCQVNFLFILGIVFFSISAILLIGYSFLLCFLGLFEQEINEICNVTNETSDTGEERRPMERGPMERGPMEN